MDTSSENIEFPQKVHVASKYMTIDTNSLLI